MLPGRADVTANYASALSNAGRYDEARSLLVALQDRATDFTARKSARDRLFQVDYEHARSMANEGRMTDARTLTKQLAGRDLTPAQRIAVAQLTEYLEAQR